MLSTERNIIVRNRASVFSLRPKKICGAKVIRVVHRISCDYYCPPSCEEPLFWKGIVLRGSIDIPRSLARAPGVSSAIIPEDIYSLRDLQIDGKPVFFKKSIGYVNLKQIGYEITCEEIAKPGQTYHVSYVEEGLYEYDDYHEDEIRTSMEFAVVTIEKPENLPVYINLFGENAKLNVLQNSSRICCFEIRGSLTSGNGFSIRWQRACWQKTGGVHTDDMKKLDKISYVVSKIEKGQETIIKQTKEAAKNTQETLEVLNERRGELRQILLEVSDQLKDRDAKKAREAKRWYNRLGKGISVAADCIQLVTFLTAIPSLPALVNNDIVSKVEELLKRITR